jgi:phosphohistidine phosphatase SixA
MILHIVRHPKSKPEDDTVDDAQRQVTAKGAKKFRKVLKQYKKAGEMDPEVIFCGPETRNMQAADIARDVFGLPPSAVVQSGNLSPDGDAKKAFADIRASAPEPPDDDSFQVMAIGSSPAISELFQLAHGIGTKAGMSGDVKLKKGSVAKMKIYNAGGSSASSQLRSLLPPGLAANGQSA